MGDIGMSRHQGIILNVTPGAVSRIHIAGHSLHPMLVSFPIAFLASTLAADVAFLITDDFFWARVSYWLLISGVTGGLAAAAAGIADFLLVRQIRDHFSSWGHFLAAVMLLAASFANLKLRLDNPAAEIFPWGLFLSVLVLFLLVLAGWLGGRLVFYHNLGPGNPGQYPGKQENDAGE
jgi:uncharacterized membrane protein